MTSPFTPDESWYFSPTAKWVKILRFLNLLENDLVQVSHTGVALWATTLNNIHTLSTSTDAVSVGGGIAANIAGLWAHLVKKKVAAAAVKAGS